MKHASVNLVGSGYAIDFSYQLSPLNLLTFSHLLSWHLLTQESFLVSRPERSFPFSPRVSRMNECNGRREWE